MPPFKRTHLVRSSLTLSAVAMLVFLVACETQGPQDVNADMPLEPSIAAYRDRMLSEAAEKRAAQPSDSLVGRHVRPTVVPVAQQGELPPREALIVEPPAAEQPSPSSILFWLPDPVDVEAHFAARLESLEEEVARRQDKRVLVAFRKVAEQAMARVNTIARPTQVHLGLAECIQRALENSYAIRVEAFNPAIERTRIVEAEAAFDAEFYLDSSWSKQDQATASELFASESDTRSIEGGFRKLLPSGMQVQTSLSQQRSKTNLQFQTLNPAYSTSFITSFRQPLLRGFGLDVNRSQICLRRANYEISYEQFIQKVRDTLLNVENAYWALAQARRRATILAENVAQNYVTHKGIEERLDHDATEVEFANSQSRWKQAEVRFQEAVKNIRDAEDVLKNLLNDPDLKLSDEIEIIPTEVPLVAPLALDQFGEVRTALENRSEIRQAREQIEAARIGTMVAKNNTMPQLDLNFQYEVTGIGPSADSSFDNLTTNRFISYSVSANFSVPIGNRARRAAWHRARMQERQAVAGLHQLTDGIVQEVNAAVRRLLVRYAQIPPQLASVLAAERNLRALQARTQRIDPSYLQTELGGVEQLSSTREALLQIILDYNVATAELEKSKGTLLDYNNVALTDAPR